MNNKEVSVHDFILGPVDTDSISFCKPDQSPFTKEEQESLLNEINEMLPECIQYDHDGYFRMVIICKAKNYVLDDGKSVKIKGSALKVPGKPVAMREMIRAIIDSLLNERNDFKEIYMKYINEAANIKDINRWASRKTISATTLSSTRANETRIKDAIEGTEIVEGDRIYVYQKTKTELDLVQNFSGQYHLAKMLQMCYDTAWVFENVLDCEALFKNYSLKKNIKELVNEVSDDNRSGRIRSSDSTSGNERLLESS